MKQLLSPAEVHAGVSRMADQIGSTYGARPLTIVAVMTGSVVLLADLIRQLTMPLRVGVIQASSYQGTRRGDLTIHSALTLDVRDRDVLLVDDIFDTGHTLAEVCAAMRRLEPASLKSAVLLRKAGRQEVSLTPDFVAFEIPDEFVVGYGLDYDGAFRNLPYIGVLEATDLTDLQR